MGRDGCPLLYRLTLLSIGLAHQSAAEAECSTASFGFDDTSLDDTSLLQLAPEAIRSRRSPLLPGGPAPPGSLASAVGRAPAAPSASRNITFGRLLQQAGCGDCSSYPNVLRLRGTRAAGLADRLGDLNTWASLAATLCARIQPRPPCENFLHYIYGDMSRQVPWSRYVNMTLSDGTNMLVPEELDSRSFFQIDTRNKLFDEQYASALAAKKAGKTFEWTLDYDWLMVPYDASDQVPIAGVMRTMTKTCKSYEMLPSAGVTDAAGRVRQRLGLEKGRYIALHLRRGDAKFACNTSVENVVEYVSCSLAKGGQEAGSAEPVVFFTDEKEHGYLTALRDGLSRALGCKVFHGDSAIQEVLSKTPELSADAAFTFATSVVSRMEARFDLLMDRTNCKACETPVPCRYCMYPFDGYGGREAPEACTFMEYMNQAQFQVHPYATEGAGKEMDKRGIAPACPIESS